jgi:hypothetical protein
VMRRCPVEFTSTRWEQEILELRRKWSSWSKGEGEMPATQWYIDKIICLHISPLYFYWRHCSFYGGRTNSGIHAKPFPFASLRAGSEPVMPSFIHRHYGFSNLPFFLRLYSNSIPTFSFSKSFYFFWLIASFLATSTFLSPLIPHTHNPPTPLY